jgi:hypothetical protein
LDCVADDDAAALQTDKRDEQADADADGEPQAHRDRVHDRLAQTADAPG